MASRVISSFLLALFVSTLIPINYVNAEQQLVKEISIKLIYNLYENIGLVTYDVVFVEKVTNYTNVRIPILVNNVSDIMVYDENNRTVMFEVGEGEIEALVNDTSRIVITYSVENIVQEVSLNAYIMTLNLTIYLNFSFRLQIVLPNQFSIESYPEVEVTYENDLTIILLDQPEEYTIVLFKEPAVTPKPTTPVSTPVTEEKTPVTTPKEGQTTPVPGESKPYVEEPRINLVVVAVAIVVLALALVVVWFLTKKR